MGPALFLLFWLLALRLDLEDFLEFAIVRELRGGRGFWGVMFLGGGGWLVLSFGYGYL